MSIYQFTSAATETYGPGQSLRSFSETLMQVASSQASERGHCHMQGSSQPAGGNDPVRRREDAGKRRANAASTREQRPSHPSFAVLAAGWWLDLVGRRRHSAPRMTTGGAESSSAPRRPPLPLLFPATPAFFRLIHHRYPPLLCRMLALLPATVDRAIRNMLGHFQLGLKKC